MLGSHLGWRLRIRLMEMPGKTSPLCPAPRGPVASRPQSLSLRVLRRRTGSPMPPTTQMLHAKSLRCTSSPLLRLVPQHTLLSALQLRDPTPGRVGRIATRGKGSLRDMLAGNPTQLSPSTAPVLFLRLESQAFSLATRKGLAAAPLR